MTLEQWLEQIFTMPGTSDMAKIWAVGFAMPVMSYLIGWAFGTVVNFINR
jgi:hypothetical protein